MQTAPDSGTAGLPEACPPGVGTVGRGEPERAPAPAVRRSRGSFVAGLHPTCVEPTRGLSS